MRTVLRIGLAVAMLTALVSAPGAAEEAEIEPIDMRLYLRGDAVVGETEIPDHWLNDYRRMDEDEPEDGPAKGVWVTNYGAGPNTNCSGNGLLPTWEAFFEGTITGDVTVALHTDAVPGTQLRVRLFADVSSGMCNESYVDAFGDETVDADGSEVTITFADVDVHVNDTVTLMVNAVGPTSQARLNYDAATAASRVELTCVPLFKDASTCLWD